MSLPVRAALLATLALSWACDPHDFDGFPRGGDTAGELDAGSSRALDAARAETGPFDASTTGRQSDASADDAASGLDDAGSDDGGVCARADKRAVVSRPAVELARLARPSQFASRALGPTMRLGATDHVWTFANVRRAEGVAAPVATPLNEPYAAFDGARQPWKTSLGAGASWTLREPSSGTPLPPTLLPLRTGESAQLSLLPSSLLRVDNELQGRLFVLQVEANLLPSKVWLATLADNAVQATRAATPLFSAPPLFALGARVDGDALTVYACSTPSGTTPSRCVAGHVLTAKLEQASAWQVRGVNASGVAAWTSNLQAGVPVLENVNGDLSVSYNSYLGQFLAVYGEAGENDVVLRTAAQPWGPWSEPTRVALPAPLVLKNGSIHEHPALAQNCERRVVISYFAPSSQYVGIPTAVTWC